MPKRGHKSPRAAVGDLSDPLGFACLRDEYLQWLEIRNYSERTIANRELWLNKFILWCEQRSLFKPADITKPILDRYQRSLFMKRKRDGSLLSSRSQHSHLVPIRAFFKWLCQQNYLLSNPASEIVLPRLEKRLPVTLTEREAESILSLPDINDSVGVRDRAILEVLYSTGIRRGSLIKLHVHDVDFDRGTLFVRQAKGKKDYMCPVGDRALAWVEKYLEEVRADLVREPDEGYLFLTWDGMPFTPNRLSQLSRDYIKKADIGKVGSVHIWRHTCATLMLENGADLRYIQSQLNHAKADTTAHYAQVSIKQLKNIHTLTHPAKMHSQAAEKLKEELEDYADEETNLSK